MILHSLFSPLAEESKERFNHMHRDSIMTRYHYPRDSVHVYK